MAKRKVTPRQLANLAKGREKLFQNQLRQRRIALNSQPVIVKEVVRQPVITHTTQHNHNIQFHLSLFEKFLETKFFPLEINNNKENLNIKQILNYIFNKLNQQGTAIISNKNNIDEIIGYLNSKDKEYNERFEKMEKIIYDLKEENAQLKEQVKELVKNENKN